MFNARPNSALSVLVAALMAAGATRIDAAPSVERIGFDDLRRIERSDTESGEAAADSGINIALSGFMLPSDQDGDLVYEFILVGEPGACSHVAPPPANQVVRVIPDKPFEADRVYQPVRVTGTLLAEHNKAQLYVLDGVRIVESAFRISSAAVESVALVPSAQPRGGKSPWKFLGN